MLLRRARAFSRDVLLASTAVGSCLLACPAPVRAQVPTPNVRQWGLGLIGAPTAWGLGYSGAGVSVAVADTGIDTTHPAFAGKIDPRSMNFRLPTAGAPYVAGQITDLDTPTARDPVGGHGTHVAGIVAASGASQAPGVAYNASLVVLRVVSGQRPDEFPNASAAALTYFAGLQNVLVYNASYGPDPGGGFQSWPASTIDATEAAALQAALKGGKIVVAATGNERIRDENPNPIAGKNPSGCRVNSKSAV